MKTIIFLTIKLLLLYTITACTTTKIEENAFLVQTIEVDVKKQASYDLINIFEGISYIYLDEKEKIIGSPKVIQFDDNFVFILDELNHSINKYNLVGEFMGALEPSGEGPGEFTSIEWMTLDKVNNQILAYSEDQEKILWLDYQFKVLKEKRTGFLPHSIEIGPNSSVLAFMNDFSFPERNCNLCIFDQSLQFKTGFLPIDDRYKRISHDYRRYLFPYKSSVNLLLSYRNKIYTYQNDQITEKYQIDLGRANISPEVVTNRFIEEIMPDVKKNELFYLASFFELENHNLFQLNSFSKEYLVLHSKKDNATKVISNFKLGSDLFINPITTNKNAIIGFASSEHLEMIAEYYYENKLDSDFLDNWRTNKKGHSVLMAAVPKN